MNKEIVLIMGLPGSGKTTLAKTKYFDYELIDDISLKINVLHEYDKFNKLVITCPFAGGIDKDKLENRLNQWFSNIEKIDYVAFENNIEQCLKNIVARNDDRVIMAATVERMAKKYKPERFTNNILPVFKK